MLLLSFPNAFLMDTLCLMTVFSKLQNLAVLNMCSSNPEANSRRMGNNVLPVFNYTMHNLSLLTYVIHNKECLQRAYHIELELLIIILSCLYLLYRYNIWNEYSLFHPNIWHNLNTKVIY